MCHVGERIVKLREEMGIRQAELCRRLNMPQATLSGYEQGKRDVGIETLCLFSDFFNVSTDYLVGATEIRKGISRLDDVFLEVGSESITVGEFCDRVHKLSSKWKKLINNMVENLIDKYVEKML